MSHSLSGDTLDLPGYASEMQLTGQAGSQAPQLMHSSLLMIRAMMFSLL
jgi:hypothetical protein